jgi:hypothetical protein
MNLYILLSIVAVAVLMGLAGLFLFRKRSVASLKKQAEPTPEVQPEENEAQKWIAERREKLEGKLAELQVLVGQLRERGNWGQSDEVRLFKVQSEVVDYLEAMGARPDENLYGYRRLFHSGPYTTVPFNASGWSISWGVWMVDAHIELLIKQATARLKIPALDGEKQEYEKRFLAEVDSKIDAAGFNKAEYFPRFQMENIARDVSRSRLVRFENTPFGLTPEEAVNELRVADSLPDIGELVDQMPGTKTEDFTRMFFDYRTAVNRSWRELTDKEKAEVLAELKRG